jgi:hypothetical protein
VPQRPSSPFRQRPAYEFVKPTLPTVRSADVGAALSKIRNWPCQRSHAKDNLSTEKDRRVS